MRAMMVVLRPNVFLLLSATLLLAGCGGAENDENKRLEAMAGGDLKETVPVSGTVSINGTPAAGVNIYAYTQASGMKPAHQARTKEDGTYCWTTYAACDGLVPGEYRVAFAHVPKEGKGNKEGVDLLQGKYRDPQKNDFTLDVKSGGEPQTEVNYDLK